MRTDDSGETLLELLIAVVIMGIAVVAIIGGLVTGIVVSDVHRKQSTAGAYVRDYAEAVQSMPYKICALPADYAAPPGFTVPTGYAPTVQSVRYWSGSDWVAACGTDAGVQQVTVQVASSDNRATEKVTVVLRKPCGPGSSC